MSAPDAWHEHMSYNEWDSRTLLCRFTRAVEGLLRISDYYRRELLKGLRHAKKSKESTRKLPTSPSKNHQHHPASIPEESELGEDVRETETDSLLSRRMTSQDSLASSHSPSKVFRDLPPVRLFLSILLTSPICSATWQIPNDDAWLFWTSFTSGV